MRKIGAYGLLRYRSVQDYSNPLTYQTGSKSRNVFCSFRSIPSGPRRSPSIRDARFERSLATGSSTSQERGQGAALFGRITGSCSDYDGHDHEGHEPAGPARQALLKTTAGLPAIELRDLRHTYATILLMAGKHSKYVQELLGHASINIALNTYSHVNEGMVGGLGDAMDDAL